MHSTCFAVMSLSHSQIKEIIKSRFSTEDIKMYRDCFNIFDLNHDGVISAKELDKVTHKIGYRLSKEDIRVSIEK